ncbi:hypothetical protein D3C75_1136710 [compost metagenome]
MNDGAGIFFNRRTLFDGQGQSFGLQLGVADAQTLGGLNIDVGEMEAAERGFRRADDIGGRFAVTGGG